VEDLYDDIEALEEAIGDQSEGRADMKSAGVSIEVGRSRYSGALGIALLRQEIKRRKTFFDDLSRPKTRVRPAILAIGITRSF
jgi:hypothetical protein